MSASMWIVCTCFQFKQLLVMRHYNTASIESSTTYLTPFSPNFIKYCSNMTYSTEYHSDSRKI